MRSRRSTEDLGALPRGVYDFVNNSLGEHCKRVIEHTTPLDYSEHEIRSWIFAPEDVVIAKSAASLIHRDYVCYSHILYDLMPNVSITLPWKDCLPLRQTNINLTSERAQAFVEEIKKINVIRNGYANVEQAVTWLQWNGTINAMRYHLPSLVALMPDSYRFIKDNFTETVSKCPRCVGASHMLALFREANATIASGLLLPHMERPREVSSFQLVFGPERFTVPIKGREQDNGVNIPRF